MRHCGSKPARYSWQCIAPKTQHQKYIAPNTKKQCTKDALHNSNRTNEAPPKMPMHSIPKVHIHNTKDATHRRCSTPKKYCNQYAAHQRCAPPKMNRSINASHHDAAHQRRSAPEMQHTYHSPYQRFTIPKMQQRSTMPKMQCVTKVSPCQRCSAPNYHLTKNYNSPKMHLAKDTMYQVWRNTC